MWMTTLLTVTKHLKPEAISSGVIQTSEPPAPGDDNCCAVTGREEENMISSWQDCMDAWTLRFKSAAANKAFVEQQVQQVWSHQDRWFAVVGQVAWLLALCKMQRWDAPVLAAIVATQVAFPLWMYFAAMRTPLTRRTYLAHRMWAWPVYRATTAVVGNMVLHRTLSLAAAAGRGALAVHLLLNSNAAVLCMQALAWVLPLWLHLWLQPAMLLLYLGLTDQQQLAAHLCSCCAEQVATAARAVSALSMLVAPAQWSFVQRAAEVEEGGGGAAVCSACPARQLLLFVQVAVGYLLPTAVLHAQERSARLRFIAANPLLFGFMPPDSPPPPAKAAPAALLWLLRLGQAGRAALLLALLWLLLDVVFIT